MPLGHAVAPSDHGLVLQVAVMDRADAARLWQHSRRAIRARFADPDAVRFHDMWFAPDSAGAPVTCGRIQTAGRDARAAAALRRFVSGGTPATTRLDDRTAAFDALWRKRCE